MSTPTQIGQRYGAWTVVGHYRGASTVPVCRCDCGTRAVVPRRNLLSGLSQSCRACRHGWDAATLARITAIARFVAHEADLSEKEIRGESRRQPLASVRHLAIYLARRETRASLPALGHVFGYRDHTTILNSVRVAAKRLREDSDWRAWADVMTAALHQQAWFRAKKEAA